MGEPTPRSSRHAGSSSSPFASGAGEERWVDAASGEPASSRSAAPPLAAPPTSARARFEVRGGRKPSDASSDAVRPLARRASASIQARMTKGAIAHATTTTAQSGMPRIRMRGREHSVIGGAWALLVAALACPARGGEPDAKVAPAPRAPPAVASVASVASAAVASPPRSDDSGARAPNVRPRYDVRAGLDVTTRRVELHEIVDLPAGWERPVLWLYADRMRDVAPSFDEFEAERIYTVGVDRGGYEALTVEVEGCAKQTVAPSTAASDPAAPSRATRGRDIAITVCPEARRPLRLDVSGALVVARRYGTLGAARDELMLGDPWYPLVLPSSSVDVPPAADHVVRVTPTDARTFATARGVFDVDGRAPGPAFEQPGVTHAPLFVLPRGKAVTRDRYAGVDLTLASDSAETGIRSAFVEAPGAESDPFDPDAAGYVHGSVRDCIDLLRQLGFVASPDGAPQPPDVARARGLASSLVIVEIPERQRLAVRLPGMLAVSDHAFRLIPADRVRKFHALQIARQALAALVEPHQRATTPWEELRWAADADGSLLADLLLVTTTGRKEGVQDIIKVAGFHPSVDQLLYAPRVAFGAALFLAVYEPDPDRFGAERARTTTPMGHFFVHKLRDRLGPSGFRKATEQRFFGGKSWRAAAAAGSDDDLDYFWVQWLADYRPVAYRLVSTRSERASNGETTTTVTIERLGTSWLREPVTVEVRDDRGERVRGLWDAPGSRGQVVITTKGAFAEASIDPDGRLWQDWRLGGVHPRFDDETSHVLRPPIFSYFGFDYAATENRLDFEANFTVRRRFDIDEGYNFDLSRDARGYYASAAYVHGLGAMRDLNSRIGGFRLGASALRAPDGFAEDTRALTRFSAFAGLGWDSVLQIYDPLTGYGGSASASASVAAQDGGRFLPTVTLSARGHYYFWEHVRTATVLIAGGGLLAGNAFTSQLFALGGRQTFRGYEANELLGRANAYVIAEQRIKPISGEFYNFVVSWVKALEIVPFAAFGALSARDSAFSFGKLAAEVGVGLRFLHDYAGVQAGVVSIDLGVPLIRDDPRGRRQPVGLWISFEQTY